MLQGDSQTVEEEKMENEKGRKECRVESRGFGTLFRDSPSILSETKNPPFCTHCPFVAWEESSEGYNFLRREGKVSEKPHNEIH